MEDLFKVDPGRGVTVDGNDVLLDPASLLPPPAMHGRITAVRVEKDTLVQVLGLAGSRRSHRRRRRRTTSTGAVASCRSAS